MDQNQSSAMIEEHSLTSREIDVLILIERTGAGCSMVAIFLTVLSYWAFKKLRTTPNLFLVFASIANAGASVASMIGYDGLQRGQSSHLCQAQAFIFEWFMQSDPWWTFAMAVNVFLVFFFNADPSSFRKYAWAYCIICFGGPMIPAIVLISVRAGPRGLIFGDAALWCWIGSDWSFVRLYSYYIPIWFCLLCSIAIYAAVGYHVFHHRNQLRNIACDSLDREEKRSSGTGSILRDSAEEALTKRIDFYGTAITEVQITRGPQRHGSEDFPERPSPIHARIVPAGSRSWAHYGSGNGTGNDIENGTRRFETVCSSDSAPRAPPSMITRLRAAKSNASLKLKRLDPVKMAYLRTSFIFGFSVLITWIPSSINRLYSLTNDNTVSFPLSVASGCVLPLQGVWNAIIYFTTSWSIVREEFHTLQNKWNRARQASTGVSRLESRLDVQKSERRDTLERSQLPSCRRANMQQYGYDDIELEDRSGLAEGSK